MEDNHHVYSNIQNLINTIQARLMVHTKLTNFNVTKDSSSSNPINEAEFVIYEEELTKLSQLQDLQNLLTLNVSKANYTETKE